MDLMALIRLERLVRLERLGRLIRLERLVRLVRLERLVRLDDYFLGVLAFSFFLTVAIDDTVIEVSSLASL